MGKKNNRGGVVVGDRGENISLALDANLWWVVRSSNPRPSPRQGDALAN